MRTRNTGLAGVVLLVTVLMVGCAADPTATQEYGDLDAAYQELAEERDSLAETIENTEVDLAAAIDGLESAELAAASAAEREEEHAADRADLERSLAIAAEGIDAAFDLTVVDAANWLSCGDPEYIATLPADVAALREAVAAAGGWYDTASEYDVCDSRRAFLTADNAVTRHADQEMIDAWDRFWDSEYGTEEEALAAFEFDLRRLVLMLESLNEAHQIVTDAVPDYMQDAEGA